MWETEIDRGGGGMRTSTARSCRALWRKADGKNKYVLNLSVSRVLVGQRHCKTDISKSSAVCMCGQVCALEHTLHHHFLTTITDRDFCRMMSGKLQSFNAPSQALYVNRSVIWTFLGFLWFQLVSSLMSFTLFYIWQWEENSSHTFQRKEENSSHHFWVKEVVK